MSTPIADLIERALRDALSPSHLQVIDESAQHAGHAGIADAGPGGETHFHVIVVSERFEGIGRVDRQRMVNAELKPAFDLGLHALSMVTKTRQEFEKLN